uniref:Uncharacterized protein n=1 Tax=Triticum urartu TaxID=4572 RepID=A0A8R7U3G1_TRIUA
MCYAEHRSPFRASIRHGEHRSEPHDKMRARDVGKVARRGRRLAAAAGVELRTAPCGKFQRYHRSWRFAGSFRFCCMVYYAASSASGVHRRRLLRGSVICCFAGCGVEQATATVSKSE